MFSGYGDGLVCAWDVYRTPQSSESSVPFTPLLGHTNKINHLEAIEKVGKLFSCSNDCTMRQWSTETLGVCERIFKFQDPTNVCKLYFEKKIMFVGCWDHMIRALNYDSGTVERAFLAANSPIKSMHIHENWLFTGSCESQIRAFNLETGDCKEF